ncbi:hypothetical protein DQW77_03345 [Roseovarius sp. TE539]|uniref:hypothetical protein n=1 Tax=Roseovarius sp. TE539 TaxID=2249812 RepID=UPI000DDEC3D1|nr:hypothetical protein [Roseovarius sp. TE539]RBI77034.1 hypothetical protein DQW77_03345 [Roseovarius sp. TE539]
MRIWFLALCALAGLAGCAAQTVESPPEEVARAAYTHDGPAKLTLYTMLNNRTGAGAHTSLMINGRQRVIFDPAGSFNQSKVVPESGDVLYGITPPVADVYTRYHARKTYHVRVQELEVSPEMADRAIAAAEAYGAVPSAQCSRSTSVILAGLYPGKVKPTWYPRRLSEQFATLGEVRVSELYEYDSDDNSKVLADWDPDKVARAAVPAE